MKENELILLSVIMSMGIYIYHGFITGTLIILLIVSVFYLFKYRQTLYDKYIHKKEQSVPLDTSIYIQDDIHVDIHDIHSMGISGISGSGKSTYVTYLLKQVHIYPITICDIHYPDNQSLGKRVEKLGIPCKIISDIDEIKKYLYSVSTNLSRGHTIDMLIVIDEYTSLLRQDIHIKNYVLDISQQGRKFNAFIWLIAQNWKAKEVGGTDIRNGLVSFAALKQRKEDSKLSVGYPIDDIYKYKFGEVYNIVLKKGIEQKGYFTQ
jgi:hypothetical protein